MTKARKPPCSSISRSMENCGKTSTIVFSPVRGPMNPANPLQRCERSSTTKENCMDEYALRFARAARRELEALDMVMVQRLFPAIESLAREPRQRGCRKVQGADNLWRIRIGDYRVLYTIDDQARIIRHHGDSPSQ